MTRTAYIVLGCAVAIAIATGAAYWNRVIGIEARQSSGELLASEIPWKGGMGHREEDGNRVYVIMAKGFMSLPFLGGKPTKLDDFDERVSKWLKSHRQAVLLPVVDIPLGEDAWFRHVWIVDEQENLNLELVREGACTADNMLVSEWIAERKVERARYDGFKAAVIAAESAARNAKRGIWALAQFDGMAHWARAEAFEEEGQLLEAIAEFEKAADDGKDRESAWFRIGKCYYELGRYQEAVTAYDNSMAGDGFDAFKCLQKARAMSKLHGPAKAIEMIETLIAERPEDLSRHGTLAGFHFDEQRFDEAVNAWERGTSLFVAKYDIRFNGDQFLFDQQRFEGSQPYQMQLQGLPYSYVELAQCCISAGDFDKAYKYATMALTMRQALARFYSTRSHLKKDFTPEIVEAGDVFCRLALSKVLIHRSSFAEAKYAIDQAKILIDAGRLAGPGVAKMLDDAYSELRQAFPGESVVIPPKYEMPKRGRKRDRAIDYEAATLRQLVDLAAGDNPPESYAALKELLQRDDTDNLSPDILDRVVVDGLERQADHGKRWQGFYGVLIERAFERGRLSEEQFQRYVRSSLVIAGDRVSAVPAWLSGPDDPRLSISHEVRPRAGCGTETSSRNAPPVDLIAIITIARATLDGKVFPAFVAGHESQTRKDFQLRCGGGMGYSYYVRLDEKATVGKHVLRATYKIEIRWASDKRQLGTRGEGTDPPIAEWTVERMLDFWIEADQS